MNCRLPALLILSLGLVPACDAPSTSPSRLLTLSGTVADDETGERLEGALVRIGDGPNAGRETTSDAEGRFVIAGLAESGFTVLVAHDGYHPFHQGITLTAHTSVSVRLSRIRIDLMRVGWWGYYHQTFNGTRTSHQLLGPKLVQSGRTVTGTFEMTQGVACALTGVLSSEFAGATISGTLRIITPSPDGRSLCHASGPFGGTPWPTFTIAAPALTLSDCKGTITDVTLTLHPD